MKTVLFAKAAGIIALFFALSLSAQQDAGLAPEFSPTPSQSQVQANEDGVAIDGYDAVAYFSQGEAVKGLDTHSCEYLNKTWHFSSAENRDKFLANPEKFSPQYGGFCTHSLSQNKIVKSNPEAFTIRDDKLYLYATDDLAKKGADKDRTTFKFNNTTRDKNWFTYQSEF